MKNLMKLMVVALFSMTMMQVFASGAAVSRHANIDIHDKKAQQRGLKLFVNYCSGCHTAKYLRYERLVEDLDIPENLVSQNVAFSGVKLGQTMDSSINQEASAKWFGKTPPDLTNMARLRGADYVYSYLTGFYEDASKLTGYNNDTLPSPAMPHIMMNYEQDLIAERGEVAGKEAFNHSMNDLTSFMVYMAEPTRAYSESLGKKVLIFLFILFILVVLLNRDFWKDID